MDVVTVNMKEKVLPSIYSNLHHYDVTWPYLNFN